MSDDCGCCATPPGAVDIENRPGLSAIAYRPGTFATFRQAIVDQLAHTPGLETLTARGADDYTITAIELWSAVADVLAFYEERIANEGFLRTASVRDSMLRLVRLIGYELAPGVAATTWLAFTVERGETAHVPARTRVKSVPVGDEAPQTFETLARVDADAAWNALQPFRARVHQLRTGDTAAEFAGVATGLAPGDVLVFVGRNKRANPKSQKWDVARVRQVEPLPRQQRTRVTWSPGLGSTGRPVPSDARVYVLRQPAAVFGHNAPDWHLLADAGKALMLGLASPDYVTDEDRREWPQFEIYAPIDPNKPRERRSPGTLTIQPTVQAVVAAALEAAKAEKEAVAADTAAAAAKVATALANVVAAANDASSELTHLVITEGGKQVSAALATLGTLQAAIAAVQAQAQALVGRFDVALTALALSTALDPAHTISGPIFEVEVGNIRGSAAALKTALDNLPADMSGTALKALEDLLKTFKKVAEQAGLTTPRVANIRQPPLVDKLAAVALAAEAAVAAVRKATDCAAHPAGAMAGERVVQIVVRTVAENQELLATALPHLSPPQRVGLAAVLAAEFAALALAPNLAQIVATASGSAAPTQVTALANAAGALTVTATGFVTATVVTAAGVATVAALTTAGVLPVFVAVMASAVMWPLILGAVIGAAAFGQLAQPGARRVAGAVRAAVELALQPKHRPAPPRYLPRALSHNRIDLDTVYPRIVGGGWLLLSCPVREELYQVRQVKQTSRTDFALTGAVTRLKLVGNGLAPDPATGQSVYHLRETAVFAASDELTLALDTISDPPFTGPTIDVVGALTQAEPGRRLLITGTDAATGQAASDLVAVTGATLAAEDGTEITHTVLALVPSVKRQYALDGLVVYGNVGFATHGETIGREVLGDGDASQAFQRFPLKKKPVTFVPAAGPGGIDSSLEVLVNDVKWTEVPTLYGASPRDEVYTTRIADDRTLTVQFGDGVTGARLPSGRQNVVARYRQGIGVDGDVAAARITTLLDRPPGLRGASNPIAADGGAAPESLARARDTAPGTVRTFGRAVSLRDLEDTTLTAGIVAKATATWVWTGERRAIHLTVGAEGGKTLSDTTIALVGQMFAVQRDTNHTLLIANYAPVAILVDATITVDDRHVADTVLAAARSALLDTLSFDARGFAQPVYLSDIFSVLQNVDGVLFVDVNTLDLKSRDAAFRAAHGVDDSLGQPQPHLLMLPARPDAATGTVLPAELATVDAPEDVTVSAIGGIPQ